MNLQARERLALVIQRSRQGMSQRAYARKLGVSYTTVQLWERGEVVPDVQNLELIAESAGYTLDELMQYLEYGNQVSLELEQILRKIKAMPLQQVAIIAHAVGDRLASVVEQNPKVA